MLTRGSNDCCSVTHWYIPTSIGVEGSVHSSDFCCLWRGPGLVFVFQSCALEDFVGNVEQAPDQLILSVFLVAILRKRLIKCVWDRIFIVVVGGEAGAIWLGAGVKPCQR